MKILIVDDSVRIRKLIITLLGGEQHPACKENVIEFFECEDGSNALSHYKAILPDWVLMDISMKNMNGFEAATQIKQEYPKANIIIVTNYDEPRLRHKAKEIGIKHYVLKENLPVLQNIITAKKRRTNLESKTKRIHHSPS